MSRVTILSGPIRSGKTTRLAAWAHGRSDVAGVLSPDRAGGRTFVDLATGASVAMEATDDEPALTVGRFSFRTAAFDWANASLLAAVGDRSNPTIVVDEVGPLELAGRGLLPGVRQVLARPEGRTILVVRAPLVAAIVETFDLRQAAVTSDIGW